MLTRNRQALEVIEAAATLPVMLLILIALVNLGFAVYARQAVQNAAAYGARMGSVAQDCRSCAAYAAASSAVAGSLVQHPSVQVLAPGGAVGGVLRLRVTGEVPNLLGPLMALNGGGFSQPLQVAAEATFRAEGW
jgi:hypothetical protein